MNNLLEECQAANYLNKFRLNLSAETTMHQMQHIKTRERFYSKFFIRYAIF